MNFKATILSIVTLLMAQASLAETKTFVCSGPSDSKITRLEATLEIAGPPTQRGTNAAGFVRLNGKPMQMQVTGAVSHSQGKSFAKLQLKGRAETVEIYLSTNDNAGSESSYYQTYDMSFPLNCGTTK